MVHPLPSAYLLQWYIDAGVDECIGEEPVDRYAVVASRPAPPPPQKQQKSALPPVEAKPANAPANGPMLSARSLAAAANSVEDLRQALLTFEGCALKRTATNLVFCDGNPEARIVFIGEAPGAEEDRQGVPFVGASGQLLDRILASIGLDRTHVLIANTVFWRPPGNRDPTTMETATCLPFVERLMELVNPDVIVALGAAAARSLLGRSEGVGRLRGHWYPFSTPRMVRPVPATTTYHPAYLLRTPGQKRAVWRDFLGIRKKLESS